MYLLFSMFLALSFAGGSPTTVLDGDMTVVLVDPIWLVEPGDEPVRVVAADAVFLVSPDALPTPCDLPLPDGAGAPEDPCQDSGIVTPCMLPAPGAAQPQDPCQYRGWLWSQDRFDGYLFAFDDQLWLLDSEDLDGTAVELASDLILIAGATVQAAQPPDSDPDDGEDGGKG